jgi:ubiquinone/menaquinone biosynthesis C-methylase UbiE
MLERVLEQELLDTERDAAEYASFDNTAVNDEFVSRVLELAPPRGLVLDLGTGPGDIPLLLAERAPELRIVAVDLSEHMLVLARERVKAARLTHQIEIARLDAKATGFPESHFDMVICNSLVHHSPEPEALLREIARVARPGAALFIKDLHRPETQAELDHLVATYATGCTDYQRQSFYDSLHAGLTVQEIKAICTRLELRDVEVRRVSDRHWCLERRAARSR